MKRLATFKWPLWHFLLTLGLSLMLTPFINASASWSFLFGRICFAGYLVFAVLYLKGWLRSGTRVDWIVCLAGTFLMPLLAGLAASYSAPLLFRK